MGNAPRFIPAGSLVETTTRTVQGRFLLRPSRSLNERINGIVARAARLYGVGVIGFTAMSNHMHILLVVEDAQQLASFMGYVNGNIAKEAGRENRWREKFWGRRYSSVVVSGEPEAEESRLRYLLSQGCKEGLVWSPRRWPGASSTEALLTGNLVRGWWFDRTDEFNAKRRGETFTRYEHTQVEELALTPLPCWRELPHEGRLARAKQMVREIEDETRERLERESRYPLGEKRILKQDPHGSPSRPSRSPEPRFHTFSRERRARLEHAFQEFCAWYRDASERLRSGDLGVEFPPGSFPPRLPFARGAPSFA